MKLRFCAFAASVLAILCIADSTRAENWFTTRWKNYWTATQRNNSWPDAFIPADRAAVRSPFAICVANGWRLQNTLSDHHFDETTGKLTEAGELRVRDIVNETPVAYRVVFVLRAETPEKTTARMASTQEAAARFALPGPQPPVSETTERPRGTPAYYVIDIERSYRDSTPPPRLEEAGAAAGSSSSGSSGT